MQISGAMEKPDPGFFLTALLCFLFSFIFFCTTLNCHVSENIIITIAKLTALRSKQYQIQRARETGRATEREMYWVRYSVFCVVH